MKISESLETDVMDISESNKNVADNTGGEC